MDPVRVAQIIGLLMMLALVGRGLVRRGLPAGRLARLAMIWAVIFVAVTALLLAVSAAQAIH